MNRSIFFVLFSAFFALANSQLSWQNEYWPQQESQLYYYERPSYNQRGDFYNGGGYQQHFPVQQPLPQYHQPQYQAPYQPPYQAPYQPNFQLGNRFSQDAKTATVLLQGEHVKGSLTFTQDVENGPVHITGTITGLNDGEFGFHIHEKGDITNGCTSAGSHFNPENQTHGAPHDAIRHVGDLGNIYSSNGLANIDITDNVISLSGKHNIIGRAVVVHSMKDDLGRTSHPDSKTTGNAGGRVSCGVIGIK